MTALRRPVATIGITTATAGLSFAGMYHLRTIAAAVVAAAALPIAMTPAWTRWPKLASWRLPLLLALLTGLTLMTAVGGGAPSDALTTTAAKGLIHGWRRTLQQDMPLRATLENAAWLPMLVGATAFIASEIESRWPGGFTLVPPVLLIAISQAFKPLPQPWSALVGAVLAVAILATLTAPTRATAPDAEQRNEPGSGVPPTTSKPTRSRVPRRLLLALSAVLLLGSVTVVGARPWTVSQPEHHDVGLTLKPLDLVPTLLGRPDDMLFQVRADAGVVGQQWRLAVVDEYDGVDWTSSAAFRAIGPVPLHAARSDNSHERGIATVSVRSPLLRPWLPTGGTPTGVDGADATFDQATATLATPKSSGTPRSYRVSFSAPVPTAPLSSYPLDPFDPPVASNAVPLRSTAQSLMGTGTMGYTNVLALETYFQEHFTNVTSGVMPAGHSLRNVNDFLFETHRGTPEQFAVAFALLARSMQVPVRIAVGVRLEAGQEDSRKFVKAFGRNMTAWPEVRFDKIGWVPFNPMPADGSTDRPRTALERAQAKEKQRPRAVPVPAATPSAPAGQGDGAGAVTAKHIARHDLDGRVVAAVAVVLAVTGVVVYPVVEKRSRRRRRRRYLEPADRVCGAWREALDALRDYGVLGATPSAPRQVASAVSPHVSDQAVEAISALAAPLDDALWGTTAVATARSDEAWRASDIVRAQLGVGRPWRVMCASISRRSKRCHRAEARRDSARRHARSARFDTSAAFVGGVGPAPSRRR